MCGDVMGYTMSSRKVLWVVAIIAVGLALGAWKHSASHPVATSQPEMVWCVGPTEVVDAAFRAEYADLYMDKDTCAAFNPDDPDVGKVGPPP